MTMANLMSTMQELNKMTNYNYTQTPHVNRTLSLVYQTYTHIYQFEICVNRQTFPPSRTAILSNSEPGKDGPKTPPSDLPNTRIVPRKCRLWTLGKKHGSFLGVKQC